MVMSNINKSIVANTELTYDIHKEVRILKANLDTHVTATLADRNKVEGAAKILKIAGPVVWAIMIGLIGAMWHTYSLGIDARAILSTKITSLEVKVDELTNVLHGILPKLPGK